MEPHHQHINKVTQIMVDKVTRKNKKKKDNKQRLVDRQRTILQVKQQGTNLKLEG
jgi:hypothetical protein